MPRYDDDRTAAMDSLKQLLQSHRHLWSASFVVLCAIISFASAWHRTSFGYWGLLVLIAYIALAIERKRFWPVWIGLFSLFLLCRILFAGRLDLAAHEHAGVHMDSSVSFSIEYSRAGNAADRRPSDVRNYRSCAIEPE